jgi:hypothetical protein
MPDDKSRYLSPSRTYEFELKIGSKDLTPDLMGVTILTSVDLPYQTFILELFVDPTDFILDEIYGQTPLKLTSRLFATSASIPLEQIDFELMYLASDLPVGFSQKKNQAKSKDRYPVQITCVSRKAYLTMNSLVNAVYQGQQVSNIIQDLSRKVGAKLEMDNQGANLTKIDQVLIPPSSLYRNLGYLNRMFGFYNGMGIMYCSHDNILKIRNLTSRIKNTSEFIIYQLPADADNTKTIQSCNDGKRFYTMQEIETQYEGNSAFAYFAPNMKHIVKPSDRLYHSININLETLAKDAGLISKGNKIFFDSQALPDKKRVSIHKDHTGYELTDHFIKAKYARHMSAITEVVITLEASLKILNLMSVGSSIKLDTKSEKTLEVGGNYILRASHLYFVRSTDWGSAAELFLMRTNRSMS